MSQAGEKIPLQPEDIRCVSGQTDDRELDGPMTAAQDARVKALTQRQLDAMDQRLLREADVNWRKVARVVASAMTSDWPDKPKNIADVFYAQRVARLVELGKLESQGNLRRMRFSEVRLAR